MLKTAGPVKLEKTGVTLQREQRAQSHLWNERVIMLTSLQAKLRESYPLPREFGSLMRCRSDAEKKVFVCVQCGVPHVFDYRCDRRFCPCCSLRLATRRRVEMEPLALLMKQPKHVVLTARNQKSLRAMLAVFLKGWVKLQRREVWSEVKGGWLTIEVTNEERGWHVHGHVLCDARWIDAPTLARSWGECVGQDFAIVKVKDARDKSYLAECAKYTVKPSEFIKWPFEEQKEFVQAIRGRRLFRAFGNLAERRREWNANVEKQKWHCGCGARELESVRSVIRRAR